MYYKYGRGHAECNVHALRYLKAVTDFTNHGWAKKLSELLLEMKNRKEELISIGKDKMPDSEYNDFKRRYLAIIEEGNIEYKSDLKTNAYKTEERRLLNRLNKYVDNHLLFLEKFFVPFSNNRAESDLRFAKIRQKIGKFRSIEGATNFAVIRSFSSTCSKNKKSLNSLVNDIFNKLTFA